MNAADRYLPDQWVLPHLDEHNSAFFTSGEMRLECCPSCGHVQHPPAGVCGACRGLDLDTRAVGPYGTIASYTVVHHAASPLLVGSVPYNVVVVELDDAPHVRITGNVVDADPRDLRIGERVVCRWSTPLSHPDGSEVRLPQWHLASASGGGNP